MTEIDAAALQVVRRKRGVALPRKSIEELVETYCRFRERQKLKYRARRAALGRPVLGKTERVARRAAKDRAWREANRERLNAARRERRAANPAGRKAAYRRRRADPVQNLAAAMRSSMRRAFTVKRLRSDKDARSWERVVGYTAQDLRAHLEKQFRGRMSWQNFGDWQVDHILPVSSFRFQSVDDPEFRACWALSNLRPMWARANRAKASTRVLLL